MNVLAPVLVDPFDAGRPAGAVDENSAHFGAGDEFAAGSQKMRPVRQVGRGFGSLVAAVPTGAALDARTTAVMRNRQDGVGIRPPMPASLGMRPGHRHTRW